MITKLNARLASRMNLTKLSDLRIRHFAMTSEYYIKLSEIHSATLVKTHLFHKEIPLRFSQANVHLSVYNFCISVHFVSYLLENSTLFSCASSKQPKNVPKIPKSAEILQVTKFTYLKQVTW